MPEIAGLGGRVTGAVAEFRQMVAYGYARMPRVDRRPLPRAALPVGAAALAMTVAALTLLPAGNGSLAQSGEAPAPAMQAAEEPAAVPRTAPVTASAAPAPRPGHVVATATPAPAPETIGSVTRLPVPRYVSLKGSEGNARRGPSLSHRIDWVFKHAGMPLRVVAEYGHWRRVVDSEGAGGWVHYSLLSGVRTAIIRQDMADLYSRPDPNSAVVARAEYGAVVRLGECNPDWCRVSAPGASGWLVKTMIWGVEAGETRE